MDFPYWLKKRVITNSKFYEVKNIVERLNLNTICQSARCPNLFECFSSGHVTFLILGKLCTRKCAFCGVKKGSPEELDADEPEKIACAVKSLNIRYVVVTSVSRDDLEDKGAEQFCKTTRAIKRTSPGTRIEVLIPDFGGSAYSLKRVIASEPDVIAYNMETVESLYSKVRPASSYSRGIEVLNFLSKNSQKSIIKSSLMLGLGEKKEEILSTIEEIHRTGCKVLVIGQYLRPDKNSLSVQNFIALDEFRKYSKFAHKIGFRHVLSRPFARSSYLAWNTISNEDATLRPREIHRISGIKSPKSSH